MQCLLKIILIKPLNMFVDFLKDIGIVFNCRRQIIFVVVLLLPYNGGGRRVTDIGYRIYISLRNMFYNNCIWN